MNEARHQQVGSSPPLSENVAMEIWNKGFPLNQSAALETTPTLIEHSTGHRHTGLKHLEIQCDETRTIYNP